MSCRLVAFSTPNPTYIRVDGLVESDAYKAKQKDSGENMYLHRGTEHKDFLFYSVLIAQPAPLNSAGRFNGGLQSCVGLFTKPSAIISQ